MLCGLLVVVAVDALQIAANIGPTLTRFASRCRVQVLGVDLPLSVVKSLVVNLDVSIACLTFSNATEPHYELA